MKKTLLLFMLIVLSLSNIAYGLGSVIVLNIELDKNDQVNLISINLDTGTESFELSDERDEYKIELISQDNLPIYTKYFRPSFDLMIDVLPGTTPPANGTVSTDKILLTLKIPYIDNAKSMRLYHGNKLIFSSEIELCNNNGICEPKNGENKLSCQSDCLSGSPDEYCDGLTDGICDQDCVNQKRPWKDIDCTCGNGVCDERENIDSCSKDCKPSGDGKSTFMYLISALIIIALLLIFLYPKKGSPKHEKET